MLGNIPMLLDYALFALFIFRELDSFLIFMLLCPLNGQSEIESVPFVSICFV